MPCNGNNQLLCIFGVCFIVSVLICHGMYHQAWCMLLNDKVAFRMQWPLYADLQINGNTSSG